MTRRKKIGLALSGGGARGFSHVGAIKVLAEAGIVFDYIAGTSAGSIMGAFLSAGLTPGEIENVSAKIGWRNFTRPSLSPLGLLSSEPMGNFFRRHLPVTRFEDLQTPFAAVAYDFQRGEEVVLSGEGDVVTAVRASCAVPGVFLPVTDDKGRVLVDGGVVSPTPTRVVKDMGADVVIAIDLLACGTSFRTLPRTALGMMIQSAMALVRAAAMNQHSHADVLIVPQIAHLRPDEIRRREEFIKLGEEAAREKIAQIAAL